MIVLDGKQASAAMREELAAEIAKLVPNAGRSPCLAVILVGRDPASAVYVRNKEKACQGCGIISRTLRMSEHTPQADLEKAIIDLNRDPEVDGILLQLPVPKDLDSDKLLNLIDPDKDVDGFHPVNVGRLSLGLPGFVSCTPAGVMSLLDRHGLSPAGKKAVVVGRSNIVGKPLAMLLARPGNQANATVTVCHSGTRDLAGECRQADFLFVAIGRAKMITADMVKPGAVVVDVGMNRTDQGLAGDCDYEAIKEIASAMTPVPGGVGPMTIAQLMANTVQAFKLHTGL